MSLNDRVFASLSKILDEWAAALDEILLQAHHKISTTWGSSNSIILLDQPQCTPSYLHLPADGKK